MLPKHPNPDPYREPDHSAHCLAYAYHVAYDLSRALARERFRAERAELQLSLAKYALAHDGPLAAEAMLSVLGLSDTTQTVAKKRA